jgi:hypothetical protein
MCLRGFRFYLKEHKELPLPRAEIGATLVPTHPAFRHLAVRVTTLLVARHLGRIPNTTNSKN